jgi:protein SCO1/2
MTQSVKMSFRSAQICLICVICGHSASVFAQVPPPPPTSNDLVKKMTIDQKLNNPVPLDLTFRDETGQQVQLKKYFGQRPAVLALVYYRCPMLCTMTLNSMSASFKPLKLEMGKDFDVITVSFDPRETPELAAAKKRAYVKEYGRAGAEEGWHFLTGNEQSIKALADSVGFNFFYDPKTDQFGHASAIMLLTPDGRISRYFYGLEYSPNDVRLGLIEAGGGKVGTKTDQLLLLCYQYDPTTGRYGLAIMRAVRIGGVLTFLALGSFIYFSIRRERQKSATQIANCKSPPLGGGTPPTIANPL